MGRHSATGEGSLSALVRSLIKADPRLRNLEAGDDSYFSSLGQGQRIVDIDAEIAHRILDVGVAK
jgi:hypothetical protein